MNDAWTPAVDWAREQYADNRYHRGEEEYAVALAEFDRMLAEHDRAVAEKALADLSDEWGFSVVDFDGEPVIEASVSRESAQEQVRGFRANFDWPDEVQLVQRKVSPWVMEPLSVSTGNVTSKDADA